MVATAIADPTTNSFFSVSLNGFDPSRRFGQLLIFLIGVTTNDVILYKALIPQYIHHLLCVIEELPKFDLLLCPGIQKPVNRIK